MGSAIAAPAAAINPAGVSAAKPTDYISKVLKAASIIAIASGSTDDDEVMPGA